MADDKYDQEFYAKEQRRNYLGPDPELRRPKSYMNFDREIERPRNLSPENRDPGPTTILRGGRAPETVQGFSKGGMVRKHGSPTNCGPMCRDSKTIRR